MTHDLLKLAEECEKREVHFKQWYETLNETELFHKLASALREAHAEIHRLRAELDAANSLVKRHEDALGGLFSQDGAINRIMHKKGFETYFLTSIRYANEPTLYYVHFDESEPCDDEEEFCFCGDTPLAAIEAAMKEQA